MIKTRRRNKFQSTRPHGGATIMRGSALTRCRHFNPRARMGARHVAALYPGVRAIFQSTRPHGGATIGVMILNNESTFQSTRPHGGATNRNINRYLEE